jgi:mono/diheme cytochrome c family protein
MTTLLQGQTSPPPQVLIESAAGADSFQRYCAPCHGPAGLGDGPVAAALRTRPPDLTALARRNDGAFPRQRVRDYLAGVGRPLAAHGTTEMPIWGPLFGAFESDARVRARLDNLVTHLESMQAPTTGAADRGRMLFNTHCAPCHGTSARGDGPVAAQLRARVPDLTTFTRVNGGVFPSERVYRIIDGRDVPSHGSRDMPVWGDVFRAARSAMGKADADARIAAVVRYLETIQERPAE